VVDEAESGAERNAVADKVVRTVVDFDEDDEIAASD
jgi:hypothetical protein